MLIRTKSQYNIQQLLEKSKKSAFSKTIPTTPSANFLLKVSEYLPDLATLYGAITTFGKKTPQALRAAYNSASWQEKSYMMTGLITLALEYGSAFIMENPGLAAFIIFYQLLPQVSAAKMLGNWSAPGGHYSFSDVSVDYNCHYKPYGKGSFYGWEEDCRYLLLQQNDSPTIDMQFNVWGGDDNTIARYVLPCTKPQFIQDLVYHYTMEHDNLAGNVFCSPNWYAPARHGDNFPLVWPQLMDVTQAFCDEFTHQFESVVITCVNALYDEDNPEPIPAWKYGVIFGSAILGMLGILFGAYKYNQYRRERVPEAIEPEGSPEGQPGVELETLTGEEGAQAIDVALSEKPEKVEQNPPRSPRKGEPSPPPSPRLFSLKQPLIAEKEGHVDRVREQVVAIPLRNCSG